MTRESTIEQYLIARVKELGGETRKVKWIGRVGAPDRLVMLPRKMTMDGYCDRQARTLWVELKNPETIPTFPANAHERAQSREHERMRALGQQVAVIGTKGQVDRLLS